MDHGSEAWIELGGILEPTDVQVHSNSTEAVQNSVQYEEFIK